MLHIWGRISSINVRKVVWAVQYLNLTHQRTDAEGAVTVRVAPHPMLFCDDVRRGLAQECHARDGRRSRAVPGKPGLHRCAIMPNSAASGSLAPVQ